MARAASPATQLPVAHNPHELAPSEFEVSQLRRINETMLRYTSLAIVIIDRHYRIMTINAAARRLLGVLDIAYDHDFLHTVRGLPYQEVRRAIDTAFREHTTTTLDEVELDQSIEGLGKHVSFTIMQIEQGAPELAVITALDVTERVQLKRRLEAVQREHTELVGELTNGSRE